MNKLFVTFEIAKQLKEKGFAENCLAWYNVNGFLIETCVESEESHSVSISDIFKRKITVNHYPTPLYQQVLDWLREKKNVDITIMPVFREKCGYDSFKRDGYTFEIMRIEPCQYLDWASFNRCAEDRDTEAKEYPPEERVLIPSFKNHYEALDKAIEEALKLI